MSDTFWLIVDKRTGVRPAAVKSFGMVMFTERRFAEECLATQYGDQTRAHYEVQEFVLRRKHDTAAMADDVLGGRRDIGDVLKELQP